MAGYKANDALLHLLKVAQGLAKVTVSGVDKDGNEVTPQTVIYTKIEKPKCLTIHVKNDSWISAPNAYVYSESGATVVKYTGDWPGKAMIDEGDGWYTLDVEDTISGKVIFNGTWGQYPESQQPGMDVEGEVWILNNVIVENPNKTGSVTVKYIDEDTSEEIAESSIMKGKTGTDYTTSPKTIDGYELISTPANASGQYTNGNTVVTYKYRKVSQELQITDFTAKNSGSSVQLTVKTNVSDNITYSFWAYTPEGIWELINKSSENVVNWSPTESGSYVLWVYAKDENGKSVYRTLDYIRRQF